MNVVVTHDIPSKEALSIQMSDVTIMKLGKKIKDRNTNNNIKISIHKIISITDTLDEYSQNDLLG